MQKWNQFWGALAIGVGVNLVFFLLNGCQG